MAVLRGPFIIFGASAQAIQNPLRLPLPLALRRLIPTVQAIEEYRNGSMLITPDAQHFTLAWSVGTMELPPVPRTTLLSLLPSRDVSFSMAIKETNMAEKIWPPIGEEVLQGSPRTKCSHDGSRKKRTKIGQQMDTGRKWDGGQPPTLDVAKFQRATKAAPVSSKFAGTLLLAIAMSDPRLFWN